MGHVSDAEGDRIGVHTCIRHGQAFGVAAHPADHTRAQYVAALQTFIQHRSIDIADDDLGLATFCLRASGDPHGNVASASRHIEHAHAGLRIEPIDEGVLPKPVNAPTHQIVHQVVAVGHRGEHLADEFFLLVLGYLAEAEGGGFVWHGHGP